MISQKGKEKNHIKNMKIKFEYIFSAWTRIEWEFRGRERECEWDLCSTENMNIIWELLVELSMVKGTRMLSYLFHIFPSSLNIIFRVYYIVDSCLAMNTIRTSSVCCCCVGPSPSLQTFLFLGSRIKCGFDIRHFLVYFISVLGDSRFHYEPFNIAHWCRLPFLRFTL